MSVNGEILVTGGAGFIGSHTVVQLVEAGYTPVIVDNFSRSSQSMLEGLFKIVGKALPYYHIDIRDKSMLWDVFQNHNLVGVIHFAAFKAVGESVQNPLLYFDNNVGGLVALLEICEEFGIENFVFSSSCTVYGEQKDAAVVDEETPLRDAYSPYGASKQMGERILNDVAHKNNQMRVLCLRYFNPIGAHPSGLIGELPIGPPDNLIPYIMQTAIGIRNELTVFGNDYPTEDGTCIRDYVHVMDVADAHVVGLNWLQTNDVSNFEVMNIGTGTGTSVLEIINTFEKVSGKSLNWRFGERRQGDITKITANVNKAEKTLNWKAKLSISEAIKDAWNWENQLRNEN